MRRGARPSRRSRILPRDVAEVLEVVGRIVERRVLDRGAVLEPGDDFGGLLGRVGPRHIRRGGGGRPVRLDERVPFGQYQPVVLVQVAQRISRVEIPVPGPQIALVEGAPASVRGEPHLAVPRARVARKYHRHRRALVARVGRHGENPRSRVRGLEKHEVGRIGQVPLVVASRRHIPLDGAVETDVEAYERAPLEREGRLLAPAGRRADSPAAGLARRQQEFIARGDRRTLRRHRGRDTEHRAYAKHRHAEEPSARPVTSLHRLS